MSYLRHLTHDWLYLSSTKILQSGNSSMMSHNYGLCLKGKTIIVRQPEDVKEKWQQCAVHAGACPCLSDIASH